MARTMSGPAQRRARNAATAASLARFIVQAAVRPAPQTMRRRCRAPDISRGRTAAKGQLRVGRGSRNRSPGRVARSGSSARSRSACANVGPSPYWALMRRPRTRHRVDESTAMEQHLDPLGGNAEEPVGLDHLEALVDERRGVPIVIFAAHRPLGMAASALPRTVTRRAGSAGTVAQGASAEVTIQPPHGACSPMRHWKIAECLGVIGRIGRQPAGGEPHYAVAAHDRADSLLASGELLARRERCDVGASPA